MRREQRRTFASGCRATGLGSVEPGNRAKEVIPEVFGSGTLPRKELHEAAEALTAGEAGLIAVGDPTIEKAVGNAIAGAANVTKCFVDAAADEIADELREALKG